MASLEETKEQQKTMHSEELLHLTGARATLRSKLLLSSEVNGKSKVPMKTFRVQESSVLSRVRNFLPQMAEADKKLKEDLEANCDLNIEAVMEDDEPHIEMSLALVEDDAGDSSDDDSSSSDNDDESMDSDAEIPIEYCGNQTITENNLKIPKKELHKKPVIEELHDNSMNNNH